MTHVELKELLVNRIGWYESNSSNYMINEENKVSESGRYFNSSEHPMVTLENIHSTMEIPNADTDTFNSFLSQIKDQSILLVLSDVFEVSDIYDEIITGRENIFDNAISKRMAIVVGEIIITSTQSNRVQRIAQEVQQKIFWELNGNSDRNAEPNPNFPTYVGLKSRYGREIEKIKDLLNQETLLDSSTLRLPNYHEPYTF